MDTNANATTSSQAPVEYLLSGIRTLTDRLRPRQITPTEPPVSLTDARGRSVTVRPYREQEFTALVEMYDTFDPEERAQGVPPLETTAIRDWLTDILVGTNVVAVCDDRLVGHVSFVPDGTDRHELAIFVHQDYQQAGIGTKLMAGGLGQARQAGIGYVWLSVERYKRYQQRFYSQAGFTAVNPLGMTCRMSRTL
jgi:GNAT superfamily N-acetyltransferase